MLPSLCNDSDCICPIFEAEKKCTQCSEWLTCCVTSFEQVLYWGQILICDCAPALLLDCWVFYVKCLFCSLLCVCPGTALLSELISQKTRKQQTWSLSLLPLKHWFTLLLHQRGLISDKSRLSLVQAWILWDFIYWSFLPGMIFGIVLHYFVMLDPLPIVILTSVPCFRGWGLTKSFKVFVLFFPHWCCLLKEHTTEPREYGGGIRLETTLWTHELFLMNKVRNVTVVNTSANSTSRFPSFTHTKTFVGLLEMWTMLKQGQGYYLAMLLLEWAGKLYFVFLNREQPQRMDQVQDVP